MHPWRYGNYVILDRLGVGGMSEVDLARQVIEEASFLRFVVIKRIKASRADDPTFVRMFMDEARITAELHHANIAQVYDFGRIDDEYYLALEYVSGLDVRQLINAARDHGESVPLDITLRIIADVLDGLGYAHTKVDTLGRSMDIVHRDVNPRNIMVSTRGEVKLIDFGVAKATGRLERTSPDHVKGKFAYMAPEQLSADGIDHRADLFAVGLTLHELVTGYGPFHGLNQVQIMHRLMNEAIPALGALQGLSDPGALRAVHARALRHDPDRRYPTAAEFRRDIVRVAGQVGGLASRKRVAAYLDRVRPGLRDDLQQKLATFSGPLDLDPAPAPAPAPAPVLDSAVTVDVTLPEPTSARHERKGLGAVAWGILALLFLAGGASVLVVLTLLAPVAIGLLRPDTGPSIDDVIVSDPADADSAPVGVGTPDEDLTIGGPESTTGPGPAGPESTTGPGPAGPESTTGPGPAGPESATGPGPAGPESATGPGQAGDAGTTPSGSPPVDSDASDATEPDGASVPDASDPVPDPGDTTEPDATEPDEPPDSLPNPPAADPGFLNVTSAEHGRGISIDGVDTGLVTAQRGLPCPPGSHLILVEGYAPQQVDVTSGQHLMLTFR